MKKKIILPIMALAMAIAVGVNCTMISAYSTNSSLDLSQLVKNAFAIGESSYMCGLCNGSGCMLCGDDGTIGDETEGVVTCTTDVNYPDEFYTADGCISGSSFCAASGCFY